MKKLVEIDPVTMTTKEFDLAKIHRSATALKQYILQVPESKDPYKIKELVLPIVEEALRGALNLPYRNKPLRYEGSEGLLPDEYRKLSAPFFVAISGMSGLGNELLKPIVKDGKQFLWMDFEEPDNNSRP